MLIALVRQYLQPYRRELWLVVAFQFVATMANLYLPGLSADIIDNGVVTGDMAYIIKIGAVMLGVTLIQITCSIVAVYFGARTAMALGRDLRGAVFGKVETFAAREVAQFGAPTLITRSTNDVQQVQMLAFMTFTFMIAAPIMCVGGIVLALRQDVTLSTLIVIVVPTLAISIGVVVVKMRPLFRLMQQRIDNINRIMREQIMGIRVIRAFVKEDYERERFAVANHDNMDAAIRVGRLIALIFPIVTLVMNVSVVAATWWGGYLIGDGELQVGTLTAFQSYLIQILMSVMMATFMFMLFPRAEVSAERITEVLDTVPSVMPPADVERRVIERGLVQIEGASFAYPGRRGTGPVRHRDAGLARRRRLPSSAPPAAASRPCSTSYRGCSMRPRAPCGWTGSTCETCSPTTCGLRSG